MKRIENSNLSTTIKKLFWNKKFLIRKNIFQIKRHQIHTNKKKIHR